VSTTQALIGAGIVFAFGTTFLDVVTPEPPAPPNIVIIDANTGEQVCAGDGSWPYSGGPEVVQFPLDQWVGAECDLGPGEYVPVAAWYRGTDQTSFPGQPFTIE
jgi:hypothetical protein